MDLELDLERRVRRLEGQVLSRVAYQRTSWVDANTGPTLPEVHTVERAVFIETSTGQGFQVMAADEFGLRHGYGISLAARPRLDPSLGPVEEMSAHPAWRPFIGQRIFGSRVYWEEILPRLRPSLAIGVSIHADHLSRRDYPQTLEITLDQGSRIFFSAAKLLNDGTAVGFVNQLLVVFSAAMVQRLGLAVTLPNAAGRG